MGTAEAKSPEILTLFAVPKLCPCLPIILHAALQSTHVCLSMMSTGLSDCPSDGHPLWAGQWPPPLSPFPPLPLPPPQASA